MHTSASSCQNNLIMSHAEPICGVNFRQNEALTVSYDVSRAVLHWVRKMP